MEATAEFTGYVIDGLSRQYGCPDAIGYIRPLTEQDVETAGCEIDPRWVWVEWWYAPDDPGDQNTTVGWREGDAVFVPCDATRGGEDWYAEGPQGRWMLAERPDAPVINWPEEGGTRTLMVVV
jgi:hypothetical protein